MPSLFCLAGLLYVLIVYCVCMYVYLNPSIPSYSYLSMLVMVTYSLLLTHISVYEQLRRHSSLISVLCLHRLLPSHI